MKKILIVVDMQNDFITGSLGTKEAQAIVPRVIQKIKDYQKHGHTIYFTKDTHAPNYLETQEGKCLPVEHCIKNTSGWELHSDILQLSLPPLTQQIRQTQQIQQAQDTIFEKNTFGSKALAEHLALSLQGDTAEIELVGLCTDICLISNALLLKVFMPEVPITVDAQCCAGVTPESHVHALQTMQQCQIKIINL